MIVSYQITIKKKTEYMRQKMIMSATNHKITKRVSRSMYRSKNVQISGLNLSQSAIEHNLK